MAKDKKGKSEGKKAKKEEKKAKQAKKGEKKEKVKASKANDSDAEDVDLDEVLAEFAKKQEQFLKVTETPCEPPRCRASATFIASPANDNELFLFGGEYFNGALATFFNDLYVYMINRDEWRLITSPNTPLPRSGHAWCRGGNAGGIYLFGGEFSSPKQGTFYHYNDFWRFEPSNREWTRIEGKGKSPPARSGHRMVYYKNYIVMFGGFQDTSQQTKYLGDLWLYDTQNYVWYNPALPLATQKPDARSSFSFLPHEGGAVLYGGYSRVKTTVTGKQMKGGGQAQRNILKPMVHQDCFFLRIIQPPADSPPNTSPTVRWERRKKPVNSPNPPRAGATMTYHKGRGIMFGGVHDVEESEEGIESEFFNGLFAWNIERNRYFPLTLRKPRANQQRKAQGEGRGGRRGRGQANEDELLRNLAALQTGKSLADVDDMVVDSRKDEPDESEQRAKEVLMEFPHPRFNAQLAVQDDVFYIYGGTFEKGDREFTFDEMYAIDLGKLDGVKQIFSREPENWLGSEDGDSEDDDGSDEDDEDDEDEDEEGDIKMTDEKPLHTESARKSKRAASISTDDASTFDDTPDDTTTATSVDDNMPHPRPFESRRDFFQRTTNEWQEVLMTALRWKGVQPETLSVKEIKTRAFEMSEEKWWDSREEITALEDEQEASGIGEVITLADKGEGAGGGAGRRR
ncbi:putative kelch-containing protein 4 [Venustampulla echinocandica]|uniref:Putative kelch-containing protein 4 n=1 Tax=Venustampulla echinocandica TaxID=2656787 RepID=A0A370THS2_9HELO|nr:putative kelch-containing protein 4 [Venustampulla echinocandica]RDL34743.1 putative kelch-containing protein 4 [Venustampulla echinocandica]